MRLFIVYVGQLHFSMISYKYTQIFKAFLDILHYVQYMHMQKIYYFNRISKQ